jgi:hypothetical protein
LQALTADKNCDYTDTTVSETAGTITATRNYKSATADYSEKHRVCVVKFDANVDGKWQKAHANYIFGPNLSENVACEKAKEKARVKVLEQHAPVVINSNTQNKCVETLRSKPEVVYVDRPVVKKVYVDRPVVKKVYVDRPVVKKVYVNRSPVRQHNSKPRRVGPAQCYADCVRGNCECYDILAEEKKRSNSVFGLGNTELINLFNFGQLIYGQIGMRN